MKEEFIYRIDKADIITSVSENWPSFACDNAWAGELSPEDVVGHSLWDFIEDDGTQQLYHDIFQRVRAGMNVNPIPFRCDSPRERRFLKLSMRLLPDSQIEITSIIVRSESRDPVILLEKEVPRSDELVRICSMCKKIDISQSEWVEIEEGLSRLRVFEADRMPGFTHTLCTECHQVALADLDKD